MFVKQIEIYPTRRGAWRWRIIHSNNRKANHSYNTKSACKRIAARFAKLFGCPIVYKDR